MSEPEADRPSAESTEISGGIAIFAGVIAQVLASGGGTFSFSFYPAMSGEELEPLAHRPDEAGGGEGTLGATGRATDLGGGARTSLGTAAFVSRSPRPCEAVFGLGSTVKFYGGPFAALTGTVEGSTIYRDREPSYLIRPDAEAQERLGHDHDVWCDQRQVSEASRG